MSLILVCGYLVRRSRTMRAVFDFVGERLLDVDSNVDSHLEYGD
jgi:hypothetical protein